MPKNVLLILLFSFIALAGCELVGDNDEAFQDDFYYSDERKIPLTQAERWRVVQIPDGAWPALQSALSERPNIHLRKTLDADRGFYWLESKAPQVLDPSFVKQLKDEVPILRSIPAYFRTTHGDTTHFVMTDEFSVQFKPNVSPSEIKRLNAKYDVDIFLKDDLDRRQAREYNEYLLRVTLDSKQNALEVANRYYKNPLTEWSVPNFYVNYRLH